MSAPSWRGRREGILSVAVLGLFLAQSCFEVETTTRIEADGSGHFVLDMSASSALLEMSQGSGDAPGEGLRFSEDEIEELRAAADTLPGVHFDTAYSSREEGRTRLHVRFSFDEVAAIQRVLEGHESEHLAFPTIHQTDRTLRLSYRPDTSLVSDPDGESPFGRMGKEMVLQMVDMRFRYVFPGGTSVDTAHPAVERTDSTVVFQWDMRDVFEASENRDSLFVTARLPASGPGLGTWIVVAAVVLVLGGLLTLVVRKV